MSENQSAGDTIPPHSSVLEIRLADVRQLFSSIDASPFGERRLEPDAEDFIVRWAKERRHDERLALLVHLDSIPARPDEGVIVRDAIHEFFANRARSARRQLRELLRRGRTSLVIGLAFLVTFVGVGKLLLNWITDHPLGLIARESLTIGGWVALWRPLEVFLYDWWPILADARVFERLSVMPVRIHHLIGVDTPQSSQRVAASP